VISCRGPRTSHLVITNHWRLFSSLWCNRRARSARGRVGSVLRQISTGAEVEAQSARAVRHTIVGLCGWSRRALISYLLRMSRATSGTVSLLWLIEKSSILTGAPRRSLSNFDHVSSLFAFHCQRTINLIRITRIVVFWSHLIFWSATLRSFIISFFSVTFCQLLLYSPHVW